MLEPRRAAPEAAETPAETRDWAFFFLLAFTAVVFFRPQDTIPGLSLLHLAEVCALGGLAALIAGRLSRGRPISRMTPELAGVAAFGAVILGLAPFSIWFGGAVGVFTGLYSKVVLIFLLLINVLTSRRRIERLTWLLVLAGAYIGGRAIFDYARGINLIEHGRVQGSVGGIFKNPNDLALNMVCLLPLALFLALTPAAAVRRLAALACAVAMLGAIVVSHSRSGTLGLVAMLVVVGCYAARQRPAMVAAAVVMVALAVPLMPASYWQRLSSITDGTQDDTGSRAARQALLRESLQAFLEHPITGVGAGQFKNWNPEGRVEPWRESHDVLLQVGAELGIPGLAVFLFLVARSGLAVSRTRRMLRNARSAAPPRAGAGDEVFFDGHSAALSAALVGWCVCALFASVAYNWTFYYLLALAVAPRDVLIAQHAAAAAASHGVGASRRAGRSTAGSVQVARRAATRVVGA